jgi:predicted DNA-binding transcriptional regulator AlpA
VSQPHQLLKTSEAAEYLRFSASQLNNWRSEGGGPPFCKLGGRVLYRLKDLDRWLDARTVRSTHEARRLREGK